MNLLKKLINVITRNKKPQQEDPIIRTADDCYEIGIIYMNLKKYEKAVVYLTKAITGNYGYKYIEALILRAKAYEGLKQYDNSVSDLTQLKRAVSDFTRVKRLYPNERTSRERTYRSCFSPGAYYVSSYHDHRCDKPLFYVSSCTGNIILSEDPDEKIKKLEIKQAYKDFARTMSRLIK